jgi:hypothetical protein
VTELKLALKGVRYDDIIMFQEYLQAAFDRAYAHVSNTGVVADITSQENTMKYRVTAVITEENHTVWKLFNYTAYMIQNLHLIKLYNFPRHL